MRNKIYFAVIFSDYQELNLKRFIEHTKLENKIIVINGRFDYSKFEKNIYKFPSNVKSKYFSNKYIYLIYFLYLQIKYLFHKKKFVFGNVQSKFCRFLKIFLKGKNQIYVDDGFFSIHYDFNKLKKESTVFSIYDIKLPKKLNHIKFFPKHKIKIKKKCNKTLFIGNPLVSDKILNEYNFIKIMRILSLKNKEIYYYPHRREHIELKILPKNFRILKRKASIETFLYNYKYNFKLIYAFGFSSSIMEISYFTRKESIKVLDINNWIDDSSENIVRKKGHREHFKYLRKQKFKIKKIKNK